MGGSAVVSGPVTGGRGQPFGRPLADLSEHGYVVEEYFLEGEAERYRPAPGTELGFDGRWQAEPAGTAPYRTRVIVYRPADAGHFNGTVVLCWNNVSAGYDLFGGDSPEMLEGGFAFAGVTVQKVGVHGLPPTPMGLAAWDPDRYGSLSIPSDDHSFDIFTQAARAVGPARDRSGPDPMGGLDVRKVVAQGGSQSAGRLATYINAVQPLAGAVDGFLVQIYFGTGTPLEVGDAVVDLNAPAMSQQPSARLTGRNLLRDDLGVPVFVVNSELEAISCHPVRQPDTDTFRMWEVAGTSHVSRQSMELRAPKFERDFGQPMPIDPGINEVPIIPVNEAALHHLQRWVNGGPPPPVQPLIEFAGEPPEIVRDELGIARGGIRLPQVEVPLAVHSAVPLGAGIFSFLRGSTKPFPPGTARRLYGDHETYVARFEEAARAAEKSGVILPRDAEALVAEARATPLPD